MKYKNVRMDILKKMNRKKINGERLDDHTL